MLLEVGKELPVEAVNQQVEGKGVNEVSR